MSYEQRIHFATWLRGREVEKSRKGQGEEGKEVEE